METAQPVRLCACGCGQQTNPARWTDAKRGWVKGEPLEAVRGHAARVRWLKQALTRYTVDPETGCWNWAGVVKDTGYGSLKVWGRPRLAHRFMYESLREPIPDGLQIDHLCRNRACVNPDHMEPVTSAENTRRGFSVSAINARRTHCANGHELTDDNIHPRADGSRDCLTCRRERGRARRARARLQREVSA